MKIHHIGIITRDIERSISIYSKLGFYFDNKLITDRIQNNKIALLKPNHDKIIIELIEPLDSKSSVINCCEGYHHICFEVENNIEFMEEFKKMKIGKIFTKTYVAPAFNNRQIVFACLQNGILAEFIF